MNGVVLANWIPAEDGARYFCVILSSKLRGMNVGALDN